MINEDTQYQPEDPSAWDTPADEITTATLDEAVQEMCKLEEDYERKKKVSNEAKALHDAARDKVLAMLQQTGKTKYFVEGYGTAFQALTKTAKVPQDPELKKLFLDYFLDLGEDVYTGILGVNHQTLNSYIKQKIEEDPQFTLPGVGALKEEADLRFRRTKV